MMWLWEEGSPPPWESLWVSHYNLEFRHQQQGQLNCGKSFFDLMLSKVQMVVHGGLGGNLRNTVHHLQIWSWRKQWAWNSVFVTPFYHEMELGFPWVIPALPTHLSPLDWVDLPSRRDPLSQWLRHTFGDPCDFPLSSNCCPTDDTMCIINACEPWRSNSATFYVLVDLFKSH